MKVVAIGGGTGLSTLLRGLKHHVDEPARPARFEPHITRLTAIVTVTDEGGSSGRLRREFRILPPGDIRNCLVALAEDETLFTHLFNYRFPNGRGLAGHSFGNLFLTALTHLTHDFTKAVRVSSEVLAIRGEIFPSTLADVRLKARLGDGRTIYGESAINRTRVAIDRLQIVPSRCRPLPEALDAIRQADLITVGPGSLYTSLIPNLLVHGIASAIAASKAVKVYVSNLMTQPGETRDYTAAQHLRALDRHAGTGLFDLVILNTRELSPGLRRRYAAEQAEPVRNDLAHIRDLGVRPVLAGLLEEDHVARHDPRRLARLVLGIACQRRIKSEDRRI
ncbi:MAG TPA: gluconeogenesis factor YvcK family protein [Terriglobia bacterium]|nr:gluconeogenesis factor YvcK family protein [Terriglobia bacterium]